MGTPNKPTVILRIFLDSITPKRIVRNGPALIVFWENGQKTVVKCHDEDFDPEKGLAMALAKRMWGRAQTVKYVNMIENQVEEE